MKYKTYQRNHVILPGREEALDKFLNKQYPGLGKHKLKNGYSSNSEDALTWSIFEVIKSFPEEKKRKILLEIYEDAYQGKIAIENKINAMNKKIEIFIGKEYRGREAVELTEVDASIEFDNILIFFEAKLYSPLSMAERPNKPFDQIARKMRIGSYHALKNDLIFYFIFLDLAPNNCLYLRKSKKEAFAENKHGYYDKWKSAWIFNYYKKGKNGSMKPLQDIFKGRDLYPEIKNVDIKTASNNMGWLTWSDLYKIVLRGMV